MRSVQDQESVGLLFGLRTGSAWLLEDKKRCRVASDERCVMCDSGVGEDVTHFMVGCGGFERDWLMLLDDMCIIVGARKWLDDFCRVYEEGKVALLLEKGVEAICNRVIEDVGECILYCLSRWWQRRKPLLDIGPPLSCHLSPSLNSWTQYMWTTFYLVCHLELGSCCMCAVYKVAWTGSAISRLNH